MASIEFLNNRIAGKEKEIAKLTKKMERILKAQATEWKVNPYYYSESDIKWTQRDLDKATEDLKGYKDQLSKEQEKANSRNVKAILDFLEAWKVRVTGFYHESLPKYLEARDLYYAEDSEHSNLWGQIPLREYCAQARAIKDRFLKVWGFMEQYITTGDTIDDEKLKKDLDRDAELKYDDIIERTNELIGKIEDANGLKIGGKGDLNGIIIGERGSVKVETIGAGGYNIQCYHFRTLIHKVA